MELLDTNDAKSLLLEKSAKHKKHLEEEIKLFSENTEKIVTNTLIIGGTLAVTYFLVRQLSKTKSKQKAKAKKSKSAKDSDATAEASVIEESADASVLSQIGSVLATQATVFLLDLAKDKLAAYLKDHFDKPANSTTDERS